MPVIIHRTFLWSFTHIWPKRSAKRVTGWMALFLSNQRQGAKDAGWTFVEHGWTCMWHPHVKNMELRLRPWLHPIGQIHHRFVWSRIDGGKWCLHSHCGWWPGNLADSHHLSHNSVDDTPDKAQEQELEKWTKCRGHGSSLTVFWIILMCCLQYWDPRVHRSGTFKAGVSDKKWLFGSSNRLRPLLECRNQPRHSFDFPHIPQDDESAKSWILYVDSCWFNAVQLDSQQN